MAATCAAILLAMQRIFLALVMCLWWQAFSQEASYVVRAGDTLSQIARALNIPLVDLISANGLEDPNTLEIGQELVIPTLQAWDKPLLPPFTAINLTPQMAKQGEVQVLSVALDERARLESVTYLGEDVPLYGETILLATPVSQDVGTYTLNLTASVDGETVSIHLPVAVMVGGYDRENIMLSGETSRLLAPDIVRREHALLETTCSGGGEQRWSGPFQQPLDEVAYSSSFGTLRSYNGGPYSGFHRGLDFRGKTETPVYASADGVVVLSASLELYGNTVILSHGLGVCSAYMHLSERDVSLGSEVAAGDLLGKVGATGLVTGAHLHFEIRVEGVPVAPVQWLERPLLD